MMLAISLLSKGVGAVLTIVVLAVLFGLDVRHADRRRTPASAHFAALALVGLFVLLVIARFVQYA